MDFQGRAFYNLLRFNSLEEPALKNYERWQIEDYRSLTDQLLFQRLNALSLEIDLNFFLKIAVNFDSPEALADYLTPDEFGAKESDQTYLVLFELWRRYRKDCRSFSIFCDELDYWMHVYDGQKEDVDDIIYSYLFELENFLDEETDKGKSEAEVFVGISSYFAHDLENFIYDFIYDLIDKESLTIASELVDAFLPYVNRSIWFEYLRLKIFSKEEMDSFSSLMHRFTEKVLDLKESELILEVLDLLIECSLIDLFLSTFKKAAYLIKNQEMLIEYATVLKQFFESIEDPYKVGHIQAFLARYQTKNRDKKSLFEPAQVKELLTWIA